MTLIFVIRDNHTTVGKITENGSELVGDGLTRDEALGTLAGELYGNPHGWLHFTIGQRPAPAWHRKMIAEGCKNLRAAIPSWPMPSWYIEGDEIDGGPDEVGPPKALPGRSQ